MTNSRLGRGLNAILSDVEESYIQNISNDVSIVKEIKIDKIIPNPYQPRKIFDENSLKELAYSIKEQGLIQPIVVTIDDGEYILIAGERRLRAVKLLKQDKIKAVIVHIDVSKLREFAIIENLQRENLNVLELAESIYELIKEHNYTHLEIAKTLSKSRSYITNILRMLKLSEYAKEKLRKNEISFGHAKSIVSLNEKRQKEIVDNIINKKLSARDVEILVKENKNLSQNKKKPIFEQRKITEMVKSIQQKYDLNIKNKNNNLIISINSDKDLQKLKKMFNI